MNKYIELCVAILAGLVVCIPVVSELVIRVREAVQEKNWSQLLKIVMELMAEAEQTFAVGADRKIFVMGQLAAAAKSVNYDLTDEAKQKISDMIDAMCAMAKKVNV
jgi:hypothetical protein